MLKCPHCTVSFHDHWTANLINDAPGKNSWNSYSTVCPSCSNVVVDMEVLEHRPPKPNRKYRIRIYPKGSSRPPVPKEVTEPLASDYPEACLVFSDSEKASAALSRRCLQMLLREKAGVKPGDLYSEIQQTLDSRQLPSHLAAALDSIRVVGNFAAHPIKSTNSGAILDVEPHEAEWLLDTLEGLFDFYFVHPAKLQQKRDALNKKLQEANKPPLK